MTQRGQTAGTSAPPLQRYRRHPVVALSDAAITERNDKGPNTLKGARFEGKKYAIELGTTGSDMQAGSSK